MNASSVESANQAQGLVLLRSLYVLSVAVFCLSLIQGDMGPLMLLGDRYILAGSGLISVALGLFMRALSRAYARPFAINVFLYLLIFWIVFGAALGLTNEGQWGVVVTYLLGLVVPLSAPPQLRFAALGGVVVACGLQVLAAFVFGSYIQTLSGFMQLSGGIQPNILAFQAVLVVLICQWVTLDASKSTAFRIISAIAACFFVWCVILTVSRSGLLCLIISSAVMFVMKGSRGPKTQLFVFLVFGLAVILVAAGKLSFLEEWFVRGDEGSLSTLTGRTSIWDEAIQYGMEKPFFGWGFGGLYKSEFSAGDFLSEVRGTNSHNVILQLFVETGIPGVVLFLGLVSSVGLYAWKSTEKSLLLPLLVLIIANGVGSAGAATIGTAALVLAAVAAATAAGDQGDRRLAGAGGGPLHAGFDSFGRNH